MKLDVHDLLLLAPLLLSAATAVAVMLAIAFKRHHPTAALIAALGMGAALASAVWLIPGDAAGAVTGLVFVDDIALLFMALTALTTLGCVLLLAAYLDGYPGLREEAYILLCVAATGAMVLMASAHLAAVFIGLELLSVPLYGLIAYTRNHRPALEAGIKYLVLSATASAVSLFGIALLYADSGTLSLLALGERAPDSPLVLLGTGLLLVGIAFKLSLAPLHLWTPDVYQGAPAPVGAFLATVAKVAVFVLLLRLLVAIPPALTANFQQLFLGLALLSILVGNLLALTQTNLKRLLGYSSIAHFGYLLLAVVAKVPAGLEAILVYLVVYTTATLGAFAVLAALSRAGNERDLDRIEDLRGLFWRRPAMAAIFVLTMLSLAGIPMTAGFIGKFTLFAVGVQAKLWLLLAVMLIGSAIGVFYYLRVAVALFRRVEGASPPEPGGVAHWASGLVMAASGALTLGLGLYPQPVFDLVGHLLG